LSSHPLEDISIRVRNFKCFGSEGGSFEPFAPINIIIGRNNSGKSALIDAIDVCVSEGKNFDLGKHKRGDADFKVDITQKADSTILRNLFSEHTSGGEIFGNHWHDLGKHLINSIIRLEYDQFWRAKFLTCDRLKQVSDANREAAATKLANYGHASLSNLKIIKVAAERDVVPETKTANRKVNSNGSGLTDLVRDYINSTTLPRSEVEIELLAELNEIYRGDCQFKRIICQEHGTGEWEIYLNEKIKGDIPLSQSGSSLKSIFIILAMLRLLPPLNGTKWRKTIFVIEEPENNLHPALLRRLLEFLAKQRQAKSFSLFITTHSPICIDWSSGRDDTQLIHVRHKDGESVCQNALEYKSKRDVLDDLDIRASDILQANCVIWVEGPTDRLYLRKWIDLASDGSLKEGVHYTIMFYGGKLLSHLHALPPEETEELISLVSINRNAAVLMDSDRKSATKSERKPRVNLNDTKRRLKSEIDDIGGFAWVTEGREVENYIRASVFKQIEKDKIPEFGIYDQVWKKEFLPSFREDKIAIARAVVDRLKVEDISNHLDLKTKLDQLCARIRSWNGLPSTPSQ